MRTYEILALFCFESCRSASAAVFRLHTRTRPKNTPVLKKPAGLKRPAKGPSSGKEHEEHEGMASDLAGRANRPRRRTRRAAAPQTLG